MVRNELHPIIWFEMHLPIARDAWFYVLHWAHPCPSTTFPLVFSLISWHMLLINGIHTLVDMVIVDLIWVYLIFWTTSFYKVILWRWWLKQMKDFTTINTQQDTCLPLAIKVYGCLHQHANGFFHQCASMTWSGKGTDGPHLRVLCAFYRQIVLVALQRTHVDSILRHVVVVDESCYRFTSLLDFLFLLWYFGMLLAIGGGF
jgi:hypothetical protein